MCVSRLSPLHTKTLPDLEARASTQMYEKVITAWADIALS